MSVYEHVTGNAHNYIDCVNPVRLLVVSIKSWFKAGKLNENTWKLEWTGWPWAGRRIGISTTAGWRWRIWRIGRDGERAASPGVTTATPTVRLLKGLWKGCVQWHVWFIVSEIAELDQQAVLWIELAVTWYQDRREHCTQDRVGREKTSFSLTGARTPSHSKCLLIQFGFKY